MPWRLWTPQVSVPRMSLHTLGAMMEKPRVLKVPAQRPMTMAKPGLTEEQAAVLKAEGEAAAILEVQKALADSMRMLNEAAPNDQVIKLKALEAMQKVADGKATKLIIPSDMQNLAGTVASIKELITDAK